MFLILSVLASHQEPDSTANGASKSISTTVASRKTVTFCDPVVSKIFLIEDSELYPDQVFTAVCLAIQPGQEKDWSSTFKCLEGISRQELNYVFAVSSQHVNQWPIVKCFWRDQRISIQSRQTAFKNAIELCEQGCDMFPDIYRYWTHQDFSVHAADNCNAKGLKSKAIQCAKSCENITFLKNIDMCESNPDLKAEIRSALIYLKSAKEGVSLKKRVREEN